MQRKVRRAAQGNTLCRAPQRQRRSRPNPPGSPGNEPPAVLRLLTVAPLRRVVAPCIQPVPGAA